MGWWSFFESSEKSTKKTSPYDSFVPPPPSGAFVPPPTKPISISTAISDKPFTGFTPPPKIKDAITLNNDYANFKDDKKYFKGKLEKMSKVFKTPRAKNCFENVKMGCKMGAAVGGIFGSLTGLYSSFVNRNLLILPLSAMGGAVSFGFFLGCGMIVRC